MPRVSKTERFRLQEFTNPSGNLAWRVSGTRNDGTRIRRNFNSKAEALQGLAAEEENAANQPEPRQMLRTSLSSDQLSDAEAAVQAAGGRQLSRLVSRMLDLERRAAAKEVDLETAMAFFDAHFREEITGT